MKYGWLLAALEGTSWRKKLSLAKKYLLERKNVDPIVKCALCPNNCRFSCPIATIDAKETTSPAGKARIAFLLKNGYIKWSEDTSYPLFYCLGCELCSLQCPFSYSQTELFIQLRREAIERGVAPGSIMDYVENFDIEIVDTGYDFKHGRALVYIGYRPIRKELIEKSLGLLEHLGLQPYTLREEVVVDLKPYLLGLTEKLEVLTRRIYELVKNAKQIVTPSSTTYYFLQKVLPKTINKKVRVKHIIEVIHEHSKELPLKHKDTFVLHENALLLSMYKNTTLQQTILRALKTNFVLPPRNGSTTIPCPTKDSLLYLVDKNLAEKICKERIAELKKYGKTVLTLTIEDDTISEHLPTKNIIEIV